MKQPAVTLMLRTASILWVIWGLVHTIAGALVLAKPATAGFQAIADAVPPELLENTYHAAVGAILNQHGWNLLWGGVVTLLGAIWIWRGNKTAIWVTAMVGGLLDVGYFLFLDLGGHVHFMPGTLMTIFSGTAIVLSSSAFWPSNNRDDSTALSDRA
ncbi:MAG: hypothetical protein AAF290_00480 [Pseudomonadota bacterium]